MVHHCSAKRFRPLRAQRVPVVDCRYRGQHLGRRRPRSADRAPKRLGAGAGATGDGCAWCNIVRPINSPHFQVRPHPHQRVWAALVCSLRLQFQAESRKPRGSPQARPCSHAPDYWLHRQPSPLPGLLQHAHKKAVPRKNAGSQVRTHLARGATGLSRAIAACPAAVRTIWRGRTLRLCASHMWYSGCMQLRGIAPAPFF